MSRRWAPYFLVAASLPWLTACPLFGDCGCTPPATSHPLGVRLGSEGQSLDIGAETVELRLADGTTRRYRMRNTGPSYGYIAPCVEKPAAYDLRTLALETNEDRATLTIVAREPWSIGEVHLAEVASSSGRLMIPPVVSSDRRSMTLTMERSDLPVGRLQLSLAYDLSDEGGQIVSDGVVAVLTRRATCTGQGVETCVENGPLYDFHDLDCE